MSDFLRASAQRGEWWYGMLNEEYSEVDDPICSESEYADLLMERHLESWSLDKITWREVVEFFRQHPAITEKLRVVLRQGMPTYVSDKGTCCTFIWSHHDDVGIEISISTISYEGPLEFSVWKIVEFVYLWLTIDKNPDLMVPGEYLSEYYESHMRLSI